MTKEDQLHRVLIIGGGPAGLLTAQALKKQGIASIVFEQDSAVDARPRDWNFGIYWAQTPLADCLTEDLSKEIIENGQVDSKPLDPNGMMPIYNGQTTELLKAVPTPNNLRLHRRNFLRILRNGLDVRYGKRIRHVESDGTTATAHFDDGTSESGNLIIGAEGAHSKVREFLVGRETAELASVPIVATATMPKLPSEAAKAVTALHPRYMVVFHPHGTFTWIGGEIPRLPTKYRDQEILTSAVHDAFADTRPGDWTFMIIHSWIPEENYDPTSLQGPAILVDLKERAKAFSEPFRTALESIPEGTQCWHNKLSDWPTKPWDNHNSTVTLIGDAAHPMTFHRGQGLNNAIHDVASLAKLLGEKGFSVPKDGSDSAITAYEREMWDRGNHAVISSRENTLAIHDWDKLLQSPLFKSGVSRDTKRAEANGTDGK